MNPSSEINWAKIKLDHPLDVFLEKQDILPKSTKGMEISYCCPLHEDKTPSFFVNLQKQSWNCMGGCGGGDVVILAEKLWGVSRGEAVKRLSGNIETQPQPQKIIENKNAPKKIAAIYDYCDPTGKLSYQVVRYEPKDFRQRKANNDGTFDWKMEGVERLLYNLPAVIASNLVVIVEGEKDCDNLAKIGITATCNPGGAKKWLPSYTQYLNEKQVIIIGDNDEPGQEHAKMVMKSLEGKVQWIKWIELPKKIGEKSIKDVSDLILASEEPAVTLSQLLKSARFIHRGVDCEIYSIEELSRRYRQSAETASGVCLDLNRWLPSLGVRPLVRGDLLGIMGGTGNLKTATAQNILMSNPELSSLLFEIELAEDLMLERSIAMATRQGGDHIREKIIKNSARWQDTNLLNNLFICMKSNVSMKYVDEQIERSSAKIGKVPDVFCIDYIQLIRGDGSRYERVSDAAEESKVLAKKWGCVGIILSQIRRKTDDKRKSSSDQPKVLEVSLEDGKESGSIENSCGLVLGVWKDSRETMKCRVLKNTRGTSGRTVDMEIGTGLCIKEKSNPPSRSSV